jgi:predicted anti-sigma-YlaC factor YlaD
MESSNRECERARFLVSLDLDGELSELERVALAAHVGTCVDCRAFAAAAEGFTAALRDAPLLAAPSFSGPKRSRVRVRPPLVAVAAAVVAIAVGAGSLVGALSSHGAFHGSRHAAAAERPFIEQQLLALANGIAGPERGHGSGRVIAS